jgi:hypothetical protein
MKTLKRVLAEAAATGLAFLMLALSCLACLAVLLIAFLADKFHYIVLLAVVYMATYHGL